MYDLADHPADRAAAPIVGEYWDEPGSNSVSWHSHRRGQLIYAQRGCVRVHTEDALFVVPPHRAVWVPPETIHAAHYPREVAFRGLFVIAALCATLPQRATVMQVDPLTRELIDAAVRLPWDYPADGHEQRLMTVLMDRLVVLPAAPLSLPEGRDERVLRVMRALRADPADNRSLGLWARSVHLSERTLTRRFAVDTGMSFGVWRQQLRLTVALERLAAGEPVTTVAIDLGYGTPSSFTTMFKKALGVPPSTYFSRGLLSHDSAGSDID
ncbi:AraC family transcriptional regulator [Pelagibius litoralis]|uniref:AraC family transcriptional regulator n=1 Tax=Pelagibius litoralis TaxID=374515 RepID=A0A967K9P5_9PROT|nr:helix-turn-helix transcriptional regulator [Pelagibius litoralis]NIA71173.1 AraC family transcriptional regulator [Pelagibius litoralis]